MTNNQYKDKDELNRIEFIISIEKGLKSIRKKEGGVVAIHASFGMGKTFFCNIYKEHLESQENHNACIVDAHLHDYVDDPFIAINQAIYGLIKDSKGVMQLTEHTKKMLLDSTTLIATYLFPPIKPIAEMFKKRLEQDDSLEKVKEKYIEALKELTKEKQLTIFIDDLDRCRPDYALKFLERLKHYFNQVPGLLFVLMIDQDQIFSSIKHKYGAQDPHKYFEKFLSTSIIDLPITLQDRITLIKSYNLPDLLNNEELIECVALIFHATKCNYRICQKILKISYQKKYFDPILYYEHWLLLKALKESYPDIFNKLQIKDINNYHNVYKLLSTISYPNAYFCLMLALYEAISHHESSKEADESKKRLLGVLKPTRLKDRIRMRDLLNNVDFRNHIRNMISQEMMSL
jgi:hypothetical protein